LEVDTMESESRDRRRRYSAELKAQVMAECEAPGVSVARVAMAHGINANVVHRWRQWAREGGARRTRLSRVAPSLTTTAPQGFVPVVVSEPTEAKIGDIQIEVRRAATVVAIRWPVSAATQCAVWLRELLQ
jgi:transposase